MVGVIDVAQAYKVPPTTILQLPYEPWGETDCLLIMARESLRAALCSCCGQYVDEAHDPNKHWDVEVLKCYAGAAVETYRKANPEPSPGLLIMPKLVTGQLLANEYADWKQRFRS